MKEYDDKAKAPALVVAVAAKEKAAAEQSRGRMDEAIGAELIRLVTGGAPTQNAKPAEAVALLRELIRSCGGMG